MVKGAGDGQAVPASRGLAEKSRGTGAEQIAVLAVRDRLRHTADFKQGRRNSAHIANRLDPLVDVGAVLSIDRRRSMPAQLALFRSRAWGCRRVCIQ